MRNATDSNWCIISDKISSAVSVNSWYTFNFWKISFAFTLDLTLKGGIFRFTSPENFPPVSLKRLYSSESLTNVRFVKSSNNLSSFVGRIIFKSNISLS